MSRTPSKRRIALSVLMFSHLAATPALCAQMVGETASQAIEFSPEVRNSWYSFQDTGDDLDSARGGYRPTLDFYANYGREIRTGSGWSTGTQSPFNGGRAELSFVQMLYDGFQTSGNVASAKGSRLVSYFQLIQQVQNTALNAVTAHLDVVRHRQLVQLAENNLSEHRKVYRQIELSSGAGVGNNVDLDQITGRLSLAHANLITARSSLRDVESRYQRVVGSMPPQELQPPAPLTMPSSPRQALHAALRGNPEFLASLYRIQASEGTVKASKSGFHPELNLTARYGSQDYDDRGLDNSRTDGRIALELHYNLYNGGRDKAAIRKAYNSVNLSKAQRDTTCTEVRQSVQVAYEDARKFQDQIPILRQHLESSDRVRQAYKDQFLIGRRSLLDVLDAENEYFQATRALVNAEADYTLATAQIEAASGKLLTDLGIMKDDLPTLAELDAESIPVDPETACPSGSTVAYSH